jgi:hypothetical protein
MQKGIELNLTDFRLRFIPEIAIDFIMREVNAIKSRSWKENFGKKIVNYF